MDHNREKLIAHLEEEIRFLRETDFPIEELYWKRFYKRDFFQFRELQEQISQLSEQIKELSNKRTICTLSEKSYEHDGVLKLLTGLPNKSKQEKKYLDKQLNGAETLTIADPYFFSWTGPNKIFDKESKYTDFILQLIPPTVQKLEIFYLHGPNSRIFHKFDKMIKSRKIKTQYVETNEIHDRVFIKNETDAVLLGTSLGGYRNKLAFILQIPDEDLSAFSKELERIKNT